MRRFVLAVALSALLAGCGAARPTSSPASLPPVSAAGPSAPTAAPTPTSALPPPPPVGDASAESATAFGRYWVDVVNDAIKRGDPNGILAISALDCQTCANYVTSLRAATKANQSYRGGSITIRDAAAPEIENNETLVSLSVRAASAEVLDASGQVVRSIPAVEDDTLYVTLRRADNSWIVVEVEKR